MVETCLPADDDTESNCTVNLSSQNGSISLNNSSKLVNQISLTSSNQAVNNLTNQSNTNLTTGSMLSSVSMNSIHSPTDLPSDFNETSRLRRSSSPKNLFL